MKKVLIINTTGLGIGGITTHILNYVDKIHDEIIIDVSQTMVGEAQVIEKLTKMGCNIIALPHRKREIIKYYLALKKVIKKGQYDVVHVHGNSATMALELSLAKKNHVEVRIAHCHTSATEHPIIHRILAPYFNSTYTNAVACSQSAGDWIFGKDNYVILRNAIDVGLYSFNEEIREKYRKQFDVVENELLIVQVGSLIPLKNADFTIRVFSKCSTIGKLLIVGDGIERDRLEELAKELKVENRVIFCGLRSDVNSVLQAADVLMMPSRWEGLPLTLVEAQTAGVKCLVSNNVSDEAKISDELWIKNELIDDLWVKKLSGIVKYPYRKTMYEETIKAGFDIAENLKKLKLLYKI